MGDRLSDSKRRRIWYVTLDDTDPRLGVYSHAPNLAGLRRVTDGLGLHVEPIWMADLSDAHLTDPALLALFCAGSFPEWFAAANNLAWRRQLDDYCELIRRIAVPMLAVCGSHQLVAAAFAGWDAVGHMAQVGQPSITMGEEFRRHCSLIPRPRSGEIGDFPLRACRGQKGDPLLAGLPATMWFTEYHRDVVTSRHAPAFTPLLEPDPVTQPKPKFGNTPASGNDNGHHNPESADERCRVQALRYDADGRVLYTVQFHPELPPLVDETTNGHGARLLRNFFGIADDHWNQ
jgi:GMP synthase-like glutamine amidotransferase